MEVFYVEVFASEPCFSGFRTLESLLLNKKVFKIQLQTNFLLKGGLRGSGLLDSV
jgi:hypothetical protein